MFFAIASPALLPKGDKLANLVAFGFLCLLFAVSFESEK
jgi:hypothetical protein